MKFAAVTVLPLLILASVAVAADPPSGDPATSTEPTSPVVETPVTAPDAAAPNAAAPSTSATTAPSTSATTAPSTPDPTAAKAMADIQRIRDRAKQVDPAEKEKTEKVLKETVSQVDASTTKKDKVEVAGRFAAEYGGIPELYLGEKDRLKTGWGDLSIAHTILQSAKTTVTIDQLYDLRQEGIGWGQMAQGLDLNVGEFVKSASVKGRSAVGASATTGRTERADAKGSAKAKASKAKVAGETNVAGESKTAAETQAAGETKVTDEPKAVEPTKK